MRPLYKTAYVTEFICITLTLVKFCSVVGLCLCVCMLLTIRCVVMQHHSAYIEVAELLVNKDPLGAVDVYSKFPTAAVPTFDDAYIFGEIVRILFKLEAYDDPRMLSNMIAMGKVMGLGMNVKWPFMVI